MSDKDIPKKLLVVIAGPTASGKTKASIALAKHYRTEILNADSRQIYKELNIGVGKPTMEQLSSVTHHLINHATIFQPYSAGHYTTDALNVLESLFIRQDVVIVAGGTGLYIKALTDGFDPMPDIPEEVTNHWTNIWKENGTQPLIHALAEMDPDFLQIVDRDNYSRLIRAVAISDFSGRPFSSFRKGEKSDRPFRTISFALDLPREELYARINNRVLEMLTEGWMNEAIDLYPHRHLKALQTVGYKELFDVIQAKLAMEDAIQKIQQSTRRYAKRQLTWLRNQGEWIWVHPDDVDQMIRVVSGNGE